eukprot:TRINITY_DN26236_c0_g1_i1.p1 TRINITY_DN26236_c0_g1~~TRINITY_DN26236_c0_g1_i1.p1  ORF type:complete len:551 (-),score=73.23 TRINITY_DN26236_c0_g1_i1:803-2335(-)
MAYFHLGCLAFSLLGIAVRASFVDNEVTSMPGFAGDLPSRHFAGYINVNEENERSLFYYLVTAEKNPEKAPLVLWLNGGPGCSSFDGWIYEHGPFNFIPGDPVDSMPTLVENPYSWSKVANMLYVDSPAGVGLSYTKDYLCSDLKTGRDLHTFLLKWFTEYSHFQANEFFISGESYSGIYVPVISREVAQGIEKGVEPKINFKGYYIGNGCTDDEVDGNAIVPFIAGHGLISFTMYEKALKACGGNFWNATEEKCVDILHTIYLTVKDLNIYDILEPCFHYPELQEVIRERMLVENEKASPNTASRQVADNMIRLPKSFFELGKSNPRKLPVRARMTGRAWPLQQTRRDGKVALWGTDNGDYLIPCIDERMGTHFMNHPEVRKAMHAKPLSEMDPFSICSFKIDYYADAGSMLPIHRYLTQSGYRALIFSGDHDMCVPYTGSEKWTADFGYKVIDKWRPWYVGDQVAGYTQGYDHNLTFATIVGAGHTVPEYKPAEALYFHEHFLSDIPL